MTLAGARADLSRTGPQRGCGLQRAAAGPCSGCFSWFRGRWPSSCATSKRADGVGSPILKPEDQPHEREAEASRCPTWVPPSAPREHWREEGREGRLNLGPRPHPRVCRVAPPGARRLSGGGPTPRALPVQEKPRPRGPAGQLGLGRASDGPLSPGLAR